MCDTECSERHVDIVIVGAGLSGLTAAYHIHKTDPGLNICLLEAKDRVGGRTLTLPLKTKNGTTDDFDLGGHWVGRPQKAIMELLDELGLETYPQRTEGTYLLQIGGNKITSYSSDIPSLPVLSLLDLKVFTDKIEKFRKTVDPAHPYRCPKGEEWDNTNLETFLQHNLWTKAAKEYMRVTIRSISSMEPSQQSVLSLMMSVAGSGGLEPMLETTEDSAQGLKVKGGTQQISKILADKVGVDKVLLNHPVGKISQDEDKVIVWCQNGLQVTGQRLILATPPPAVDKITFEPLLPVERKEINKRYVFGDYIKIIVTYEEDFWTRKGFVGEIETNGGPSTVPGCDNGPITVTLDATSHTGSPALVVFIAGIQARQWGQQTEEVRRTAVLQSLSTYYGTEALEPLDYCEKDWSKEEFIGGALASLGTGAMKYFEEGIGGKFMRIHFAGTETALEWDGNMSGAVEAGKRAANEVLNILQSGK
ncbi:probable flavin-containing monoamine oxidase A [Pecten maximus]|uniref:probable flavin-containing monoamine oxidase A n=1 Tax=Pecten maximus TaxID=6579 RepID=UPI0014580053|nr:probable flavin-containing monoamine oxidase A [Pecten maximus]XP_033726342.1 probable flavin-containing monoamine oxidase A [Pecten maximus]